MEENISDLERITKYDNDIGFGFLTTVTVGVAPNLRRNYFDFLDGIEKLAEDYNCYLNGLRERMAVPKYVLRDIRIQGKDPNREFRDILTETQDKVNGAIRLVRNLRELDQMYTEGKEPSESLKDQYPATEGKNCGFFLNDFSKVIRRFRWTDMEKDELLYDSYNFGPVYNKFGDTSNDINPHLFLVYNDYYKSISLAYDSSCHYIMQLLYKMAPSQSEHANHNFSKDGVELAKEGYVTYGTKGQNNCYDALPLEFQERAEKLVEKYVALLQEYVKISEHNDSLYLNEHPA